MRFKVTAVVGLIFVGAALGSGTASAAGNTPQGLKADGLRLQGIAQVYRQLQGSTPQGLKADGLRLQGIARAYESRPAASFYTPRALRAEGLRWQGVARTYGTHETASTSSRSGFDWSDAGIGALGGFGILGCAAALVLVARRVRRTKLAV